MADHSKVFLQGNFGTGKSELAKAYAKQWGKKYTGVIYVNCPSDQKRAVIDPGIADDPPDESDETCFKRQIGFSAVCGKIPI